MCVCVEFAYPICLISNGSPPILQQTNKINKKKHIEKPDFGTSIDPNKQIGENLEFFFVVIFVYSNPNHFCSSKL